MCNIEDDINLLLKHGNLGYYEFCEIVQIVLISEDSIINYYTNIEFSSEYMEVSPFELLTDESICIKENYKLVISKYTIPIEKFKELYLNAAQYGMWKYNNTEVIIDDAFVTDKKFIPGYCNNPTRGQYNSFIPLEYGLYGSNFFGNYYIHELFSRKNTLCSILQQDDILKIQAVIKKCNLVYRLDKMQDRIGNVVCKFPVEILKSTPKSIGDSEIVFDFSLNRRDILHRYCLHIFQEHDGVVYQNIINDDFDCSGFKIEPNQSKTTISVLDTRTGLTLFCVRFDFSPYSDYYSQITPPTKIGQRPSERTLYIDDQKEVIKLHNFQMKGSLYTSDEMTMSAKRKLKLYGEWFRKKGFLKAYTSKEHDAAIEDIINIINNKDLIWDLQELWIIDPYLCADDLIRTAFRCSKKGIVIKALCSHITVKFKKFKGSEQDKFIKFKEIQCDKIEAVLGKETDIKLEYRIARNGHGVLFHDRFIMLKYEKNESRVWSLGSSINSIGNKHSIIHIVEVPEVLLSIFNNMWSQTENEDCVLYKTESCH